FSIRLLVRDAAGNIAERPAGLIASVVTPKELRGKGYATAMLEQYFAANATGSFILYSDVGPAFYERFGFTAFPVGNIEKEAQATDAPDRAEPLSLDEFATALDKVRCRVLGGAEVPSAAVAADK